MSEKYREKEQKIRAWMKENVRAGICIAFSGGADSSLLLALAAEAAKESGSVIHAVTFDTVLHPRCDTETAKAAAARYGACHHVLFVDELANEEIKMNPKNRCYLCKKGLFEKLLALAEEVGAGCVMEGTNADDLKVYRPGIQAVRELGIESPLAKFGFTKAEVRELAAKYGIPEANRPSAPCLATRLPYGTELIPEELEKIAAGEQFLRELGFYNVRLRLHGKIARIETDQESFPELLACREKILFHLKNLGFHYITLDMEGFRSGSMDE